HLALDLYLVGDEHATGFECLVPFQSPLAAVQLALVSEAGTGLPPWIRAAPLVLAVERNLHRGVCDLKIADQLELVAFLLRRVALDALAAEGDLGVRFRIEEIRAAQMLVPILDTGVDAVHPDPHVHAGVLRVGAVAA